MEWISCRVDRVWSRSGVEGIKFGMDPILSESSVEWNMCGMSQMLS